ncbi:Cell division protein FtsA [bioreactor metagenome]|uniref:Cell division protein FtsA n=1 Tax=bioreactor metagenome TaxID=1076179 RepID=A0A644V8W4_9ZZZZ|nr:pilus assembly protein PilM [Candidatus Elulimicrobiales bacterium]
MAISKKEKVEEKKKEQKDKRNVVESCVGVDIGTYAIKVMQIRKDSNQIHLETYGELEMAAYDALPPGSLANLGEEKTVTAIRDLFTAAKITSSKGVFAIPMQDCFITSITIPKVSDAELNSLIPIEARKYLPIPISEVQLNYWRTEVNFRTEDKEDTIVIAAVKNDTFNLYNRYAKKLGFKDFSFEIESLSQARIVADYFKDEKPMLCIDIGGKYSFATLLHKNIVRDTNLIRKGSYDNTSQISKVLGLSMDVAEGAKRVFGYLGDASSPHLAEVMGLASFPLFDEIKYLLLNYERKYNIIIERVVLSGGGALQKGIKDILSEFLKKEVILLDPFSSIVLPENLKEVLLENDDKYAVASGLALRDYI